MSSSSIHGSVTNALLGVLLLHLRYGGIKLPPAGIFVLKAGGGKQTKLLNVSEKAHLYPQAQFQMPNLLLFPSCCFPSLSSPGLQERACSCTTFLLAYGTAVQDWFVCQGTLNKVIWLTQQLWHQSICFFLSHEVQVAALAAVMSSRHLHSANDVRSHSSLFTRICTASGDSWKYLTIGKIFKW